MPIIALGRLLLLTASAITAPERFLALSQRVEAVQLAEPKGARKKLHRSARAMALFEEVLSPLHRFAAAVVPHVKQCK